MLILTIGHSDRSIEEFLELLALNGVRQLVDVRTVPGSRRNPQFLQETLRQSLGQVGIAYLHLKGLGGLRRPLKESVNAGWRNDSFRGFADYMQTAEFEQNLADLMREAEETVTVVMCAEAVPWRCHRSLIADALSMRGIAVEHIIGTGKRRLHSMTPFAQVEGKRITYPPAESGRETR